MTKYHGKTLIVRRDRTVVYDGKEIGRVFPRPGDARQTPDWCYEHASRIDLRDLHPERPAGHTKQVSFTKIGAAQFLADLDGEIVGNPQKVHQVLADRDARVAAFRARRKARRNTKGGE